MNKAWRGFFLVAIFAIAVVLSLRFFSGPGATQLNVSAFTNEVAAGNIVSAHWQGSIIRGKTKKGSLYEVRVAPIESKLGESFTQSLLLAGVDITSEPPSASSKILPFVAVLFVPLVVIVMFYYVFVKPAQKGSSFVSGAAPPHGTQAERLAKLDDLRARNLVSEDEHRRLREKILSEL